MNENYDPKNSAACDAGQGIVLLHFTALPSIPLILIVLGDFSTYLLTIAFVITVFSSSTHLWSIIEVSSLWYNRVGPGLSRLVV